MHLVASLRLSVCPSVRLSVCNMPSLLLGLAPFRPKSSFGMAATKNLILDLLWHGSIVIFQNTLY